MSASRAMDVALSNPVKAVKSVMFGYTPTQLTVELLTTFRDMINDAIRICLEEYVRGRLKLRNRLYRELQGRYGVVSCFPYSVAEVAWSIAKKYRRWQRKPYAKRLMMKMDSQDYSLESGVLSLPFKKGRRILVPLQYGAYQRAFLLDETLKRGSVTLTEHGIYITFTRESSRSIPVGRTGIDLNEKVAVASNGVRYDLTKVARLHTEYGVRRSEFHQKHSHDRRLKRKYSMRSREKERVRQLLHATANEIVESAKAGNHSIVLERLRGIRQVHQRASGESRGRRRRISQWPFRLLQSYIAYKAKWKGVEVEFVSAAWTSRICHACRRVNRNLKLTEREWRCPSCGATLDRDLNAAVNIERRGKIPCLGEVRPGAQGTDEAVKGNEQTTAPILRAEALKSLGQESFLPDGQNRPPGVDG
jgi:putative transposase